MDIAIQIVSSNQTSQTTLNTSLPPWTFNTTSLPDDVRTDVTSTVGGEWRSFKEYTEYKVAVWVLLVYRPLCAALGCVGNLLCGVLALATSLRHSPTVVYMVTLALLDWAVSLLGVLTFLTKDVYLGEGRIFTETWHCKAFYFGLLFVIHWDSLTLVSMTAQRYVAVAFPLQAARWATKTTAVVNLLVVAVVACVANVVHLATFRMQPYDGSYRGGCSVGQGLGRLVQLKVYPWIDFALYFFIPTVCISVFNVLILRHLKTAERFKRQALLGKTVQDPAPLVVVSSEMARRSGACASRSAPKTSTDGRSQDSACGVTRPPDTWSNRGSTASTKESSTNSSKANFPGSNSGGGKGGTNNQVMLTRMLMMVSAAYLLLTLPLGVFVVVSRVWNPTSGYAKARFSLFRDISESLMMTNHSINFLLYCLSGRRFRHKVARVLCRACPCVSGLLPWSRDAGSRSSGTRGSGSSRDVSTITMTSAP